MRKRTEAWRTTKSTCELRDGLTLGRAGVHTSWGKTTAKIMGTNKQTERKRKQKNQIKWWGIIPPQFCKSGSKEALMYCFSALIKNTNWEQHINFRKLQLIRVNRFSKFYVSAFLISLHKGEFCSMQTVDNVKHYIKNHLHLGPFRL